MNKEDVVYIYTMKYYSAIKRNETESFVEMWMDLETLYRVNEVNQKEKNKTAYINMYVESKEMV